MTLNQTIKEFEEQHQARVLYLTEYGSRLYGTFNEDSDTDIKGIFIQNKDQILLKNDLNHFTANSNQSTQKNQKGDIDLQLFSVNKFFNLIRKGETGALDILFSIFVDQPELKQYKNDLFVSIVKNNYKKFLNKNLHSFTGYAVGMATKYGIKGTRYKELKKFNEYLGSIGNTKEDKLGLYFSVFVDYFKETKYLKMTRAKGPKTLKTPELIDYVEILGKKFSGDVSLGYFINKTKTMEEQFGNRTKLTSTGIDFKGLSHSCRVLSEVEELLKTGFITFPLKEKDYIKRVKESKIGVDEVMEFINTKLDQVNSLFENTTLPEKSDLDLMNKLELCVLDLGVK